MCAESSTITNKHFWKKRVLAAHIFSLSGFWDLSFPPSRAGLVFPDALQIMTSSFLLSFLPDSTELCPWISAGETPQEIGRGGEEQGQGALPCPWYKDSFLQVLALLHSCLLLGGGCSLGRARPLISFIVSLFVNRLSCNAFKLSVPPASWAHRSYLSPGHSFPPLSFLVTSFSKMAFFSVLKLL